MKHLLICLTLLTACSQPEINQSNFNDTQTIYQFTVTDLYGEDFSFQNVAGKKLLIVNTASKCGLTPQYEELQTLYDTYGGDDFEIIGFPANNFLFQEPGSDEDIASFCKKNYGVTFPMMSKISVKGKDQHPVYQFLTNKALNGYEDSDVAWNFQKYLIGKDGKLEKVIKPKTTPLDDSIVSWIEG